MSRRRKRTPDELKAARELAKAKREVSKLRRQLQKVENHVIEKETVAQEEIVVEPKANPKTEPQVLKCEKCSSTELKILEYVAGKFWFCLNCKERGKLEVLTTEPVPMLSTINLLNRVSCD